MPSVRWRHVRLVKHLPEGMGGLHHVAREASFKAKASEQSLTGIGGRRVIVVAGERRIRDPRWAGSGYVDAERRPRNHSR
jgi:hypothetical protein